MKFCPQLSSYYPDKNYGGDRIFNDMLEQAILCDQLHFDSVSITEHHLINILMQPDPLQFAVKIAAHTSNIKIITAVSVLPLHDMRIYAGQLVAAQIFTDNRLIVGVGRGAFAFELDRLGVPLDTTREKFEESVEVLQALLSQEEVSWQGKYYNFSPLTIMPRPITPGGPPMLMAVLNPEGIYACTKKGFHIMTTPLAGHPDLLQQQAESFRRAKEDANEHNDLSLSLSLVAFITKSQSDKQEKLQQAYDYYSRFDNVYTGPGIVKNGMIEPLPRKQSLAELEESLLIGSVQEVTDQIAKYHAMGIDRLILNMNFGASQTDTLASIDTFAKEVMPLFSTAKNNYKEAVTI